MRTETASHAGTPLGLWIFGGMMVGAVAGCLHRLISFRRFASEVNAREAALRSYV